MAGTLYIVATPIGNLDDMPPRVAATFGAADFIAAEDTRVTMKLLNFLGLKKPMVSYYEHALQKGEGILRRIEAGESCALCSDAGMPCVSDPGEVIVRDALARGIKVVPVPAASACVTALAVSGQDTSRWVFEGFLPVNRKQKIRAGDGRCAGDRRPGAGADAGAGSAAGAGTDRAGLWPHRSGQGGGAGHALFQERSVQAAAGIATGPAGSGMIRNW